MSNRKNNAKHEYEQSRNDMMSLSSVTIVGKQKKRRKKNTSGGGTIYELSFSLILLFWCLVFLFYSRLGLSHANEGNMTLDGGRVNCPGGLNLNGALCGDTHSEVANRSHSGSNGVVLEVDSPIGNCNDSKANQDPANFNFSYRVTNRLEELIWNALNGGALVCALEEKGELNTSSPIELPSGKPQHSTYLNFDEFRNITRLEKGQGVSSRLVNITHRLETDGKEYNYAAAMKGAKVVAHNKEAKGADNILGMDHDKYLRNPCSVGEKFVVVELSEETLVDVVKIANFEHYSSNFKEFELFGSLNYPTETWTQMGKFVASNVKHIQIFKLPEPTWVRYLKLSLLSHYGSEFYCTLSVLEVYGVDAIERMLEDLFVESEEPVVKQIPGPNSTAAPPQKTESSSTDEDQNGNLQNKAANGGTGAENMKDSQGLPEKVMKNPVIEGKVPDHVAEVRQQPISRVPGDTVLKILMQKVRSLELNLSVLEEYIKELNRRQKDFFPELDIELFRISSLFDKSKTEIMDLLEWKTNVEKSLMELDSLKAAVTSGLDALVRENINLRLDVEMVVNNQANLESKELAVLAVSFFFICFAIIKLVLTGVLTFLGSQQLDTVCQATRGWVMILVSSSMTIFITLLSG